MARRLLRVLMAVALMSALATPHALATHDDQKSPPLDTHVPMSLNIPAITNVKAVCEVHGIVHVDDQFGTGGLNATDHNHNHYVFTETSITCTDTNPLDDQDIGVGSSFRVWADGGSDGCLPTAMQTKDLNNCTSLKLEGKIPGHGEWDGLGWSHGSGYANNSINTHPAPPTQPWGPAPLCDSKKPDNQKGDIHVEDLDETGKFADGWVKFFRELAHVDAWGCLQWKEDPNKKKDFFIALLIFTPTDPPGTPKLQNATLDGVAVVGN